MPADHSMRTGSKYQARLPKLRPPPPPGELWLGLGPAELLQLPGCKPCWCMLALCLGALVGFAPGGVVLGAGARAPHMHMHMHLPPLPTWAAAGPEEEARCAGLPGPSEADALASAAGPEKASADSMPRDAVADLWSPDGEWWCRTEEQHMSSFPRA